MKAGLGRVHLKCKSRMGNLRKTGMINSYDHGLGEIDLRCEKDAEFVLRTGSEILKKAFGTLVVAIS